MQLGHLLIEAVELPVIEARLVETDRNELSVEKLVDVLCIRIIHGPAAVSDLELSLSGLFQKVGEPVVADLGFDADLAQRLDEELSDSSVEIIRPTHIDRQLGQPKAARIS